MSRSNTSAPRPPEGVTHVGRGQRYRARALSHLELGTDARLSWARKASASSDYGGGWAASQAAGPPKVFPRYGDHTGAWAQSGQRVGVATLDLTFASDVRAATGILVLETLGAGALFAITAGRGTSSELLFYAPATRLRRPARALYVELDGMRELRHLRLWVDTDAGPREYNEIDAVALVHGSIELDTKFEPPQVGGASSGVAQIGFGTPMTSVYEMFWDCGWCDATKLLGKTHRSCPMCGAPQDPTRRYFPPEDEKVAVVDHIYYGRDLICDHCQTPNSAAAKHCVGCGAPIGDGDAQVSLIEWRAKRVAQEASLKRRRWIRQLRGLFWGSRRAKILSAIGAVALLAVLATLITLFWTRSATVEVTGHRWERSVAVERYESVSQGSWCDSMPSDAYSVSQSTRQSGTNQIPDGEECSTVNVDNGDGTYRQEYQCQTRYRSEPVYDEWCDYYVDRWVHDHDEVASGDARAPPPYWPYVSVSDCASLGCTRKGGASGKYVLQYVEVGKRKPELLECGFDQARWESTEPGTQWDAKIRVITGGLVCKSVVSP